jgi:citrate lyase subunit beta/citryl-CoA lyase
MGKHPEQVLFAGTAQLPTISACDHYAGNLKLASKAIKLQKELGGRFDITLDLEDGAEVGNEQTLRDEFIKLICSPENTFQKIGMRVHDFDSPFWREDLSAVVKGTANRISHITIPKIKETADLSTMLEHLQKECRGIGPNYSIPVHVLIESPQALDQVSKIASLPWVRSIELGLMDFVSCHSGVIPASCMQSPGQFEHPLIRRAKEEIAAAAILHNKIASHNVTTAYNDPEQTRRDALRARNELGFLRMWSIHPCQILPILEAMSPAAQELELAARIIISAYKNDWAPISIDGRLHDRASYRYYWNQLCRAYANGVAIDSKVVESFFFKGKQDRDKA